MERHRVVRADQQGRRHRGEVTADETDDECAMLLSDYVKSLGASSSRNGGANVAALLANPAPRSGRQIVREHQMFDLEIYVASLGVVAAACGLVPIADPSRNHRVSSDADLRPNPGGSRGTPSTTWTWTSSREQALRSAEEPRRDRTRARRPSAIVGVETDGWRQLDWTRCRPAPHAGHDPCPRTLTRPARCSANTTCSTWPPRVKPADGAAPRRLRGVADEDEAVKIRGMGCGDQVVVGGDTWGEPGRRAVRRVPPAVPVERELGGRGG